MIKRILGGLMLVSGLVGIGIAVAAAVLLPRLLDNVVAQLDNNLQLTTGSLETVADSLLLAQETLGDVDTTLVTVEDNLDALGQAVKDSGPLLDQITAVTSEDLPQSIETVQASIPDVAQVAAAVDDTLTTLNSFRIDQTILGFDINYDLGVDYDPTQPFDETILDLGESLDGLPASLRSLRVYIGVTRNNLNTISQGMFTMADDVAVLNGRLDEVDPLLTEYLQIITETTDRSRALRTQLNTELATMKRLVWIGMVWLALSQLAPLYLGWELLTNRRPER